MEGRQCFCALPDCLVCKTADIAKSQSGSRSQSQSQSWSAQCEGDRGQQCFTVVGGHGQELSPSAKTIIMNLRTTLPELFKQGYLAHGANWKSIPSKNATQSEVAAPHGTKMDNLVARLVGTSARTVVRIATQAKKSQSASAVDPSKDVVDVVNAVDVVDTVKPDDVPVQEVSVRGMTLETKKIALNLGRAALNSLLYFKTDLSYIRQVLLLFDAGVEVGTKHHTRHTPRAFGDAAMDLLKEDLRVSIQDQHTPANLAKLKLPAFWSLSVDGVPAPALK